MTECSHTGQFVCGTPLCEACEGFTDNARPNGNWGFANHGHRRKPVACEAGPPVTAQPDAPVFYVACPFCGEADFDRPGLKMHLLRGWCDGFNAVAKVTPTPDAPTAVQDRGGGLSSNTEIAR